MTTDLANLAISVESKSVPKAANDLDRLTDAAGRTEKQTRKVTTATERMNQRFAAAKVQLGALKSQLLSVQGAFASLGIVLGVRELIRTVDTYKSLESRLSLVTSNTQQLVATQEELYDIANDTRGAYTGTVDLYTRLARSTKALGVEQSTLFTVTEAVNKAIVVSGAESASASAALFQLGQGLAAGALRGEELNSVLEQTPRLAEAIAAGMNVQRGQLKDLGAEGKITAEKVIAALESQAGALDAEFKAMQVTLGQGWTVLSNALGRSVSQFDDMIGSSSAVANAMLYLADNFEIVEAAMAGMGTAAVLMATRYLPSLAASIAFVKDGIIALTAAIAANPLGAIAVGLSATVAALVYYRDTVVTVAEESATVWDIVVASYETGKLKITNAIEEISRKIDDVFGPGAGDVVMDFVSDFVRNLALLPNKALSIIYGVAKTITDSFVIAFEEVINAASDFGDNLGTMFSSIGRSFELALSGEFSSAGEIMKRAFDEGFDGVETHVGKRIIEAAKTNLTTNWTGNFTDLILTEGKSASADLVDEVMIRASSRYKARLAEENANMGGNTGSKTIAAPNEDVVDRVKELQREREELDRLIGAHMAGEASYKAVERAIAAENEARKLGLNGKQDEYHQVVGLSEANARLREELDQLIETEKNHATAVEDIRSQLVSLFPNYENLAAEAQRWRDEALKNLDETKAGYDQFAADVDRIYNQMLKEAREKDLQNSKDWMDGVTRALDAYQQDAQDAAANWENVTTNALGTMEDAFVQWATTGKLEARDMVNSILADLARLAVRKYITSNIASIFGMTMHTGGLVGSGGSASQAPLSAFATAERYHNGGITGLGPNEVPIVAERGEEVLTRNDPRHRFNGGMSGGNNITIQTNVTVEGGGNGDATSDRRSGERIGKVVNQIVETKMAAFLQNQMRPGNMLNPNGSYSSGSK